jgi:hypothetical protein
MFIACFIGGFTGERQRKTTTVRVGGSTQDKVKLVSARGVYRLPTIFRKIDKDSYLLIFINYLKRLFI